MLAAKSKQDFKRLWEIDAVRGIAIVMMLVSNAVFDLHFFRIAAVDISSGFWWAFARTTAALFIFIVGVSLVLSTARFRNTKGYSGRKLTKKLFVRGLKIFGLGLLITAATFTLFPQNTDLFGVLHLIGLSIIFARPFLALRFGNLALGLAAILIGVYLSGLRFDFPWLLWLGLSPANNFAVDYTPLFPWFGFVLLGMFTGNLLYKGGVRQFRLPELSTFLLIRGLNFLGRNSLKIYLAHQPVFVVSLYLLFLL